MRQLPRYLLTVWVASALIGGGPAQAATSFKILVASTDRAPGDFQLMLSVTLDGTTARSFEVMEFAAADGWTFGDRVGYRCAYWNLVKGGQAVAKLTLSRAAAYTAINDRFGPEAPGEDFTQCAPEGEYELNTKPPGLANSVVSFITANDTTDLVLPATTDNPAGWWEIEEASADEIEAELYYGDVVAAVLEIERLSNAVTFSVSSGAPEPPPAPTPPPPPPGPPPPPPPATTLNVDLTARPTSGRAPLHDVDLQARVSGTAGGTINYTFYCNRSDAGTNVIAGWAAKFDGVTNLARRARNACDYARPGTYTAKVIVERGGRATERRVIVEVTRRQKGFSSPFRGQTGR